MIWFLLGLIFGIIGGIVIDKKWFKKDDLTTDDHMDALYEKGYFVRISRRNDKKDNQMRL